MSTLLHKKEKVILICCFIVCVCHFSNVFNIKYVVKIMLKNVKSMPRIKKNIKTIFTSMEQTNQTPSNAKNLSTQTKLNAQ